MKEKDMDGNLLRLRLFGVVIKTQQPPASAATKQGSDARDYLRQTQQDRHQRRFENVVMETNSIDGRRVDRAVNGAPGALLAGMHRATGIAKKEFTTK